MAVILVKSAFPGLKRWLFHMSANGISRQTLCQMKVSERTYGTKVTPISSSIYNNEKMKNRQAYTCRMS